MFRPLRAILRWDIQLVIISVFEGKLKKQMTANNIPRYNDQTTYVQRTRCIKIVLQ
jgi:hypothetical protein